jgi:hypothetical protein
MISTPEETINWMSDELTATGVSLIPVRKKIRK